MTETVVSVAVTTSVSARVTVVMSYLVIVEVPRFTVLVTVSGGSVVISVSVDSMVTVVVVVIPGIVVVTTVRTSPTVVMNTVLAVVEVTVVVVVTPDKETVQGEAGTVTVVDTVLPEAVIVCVTSWRPRKDEQNEVALPSSPLSTESAWLT